MNLQASIEPKGVISPLVLEIKPYSPYVIKGGLCPLCASKIFQSVIFNKIVCLSLKCNWSK